MNISCMLQVYEWMNNRGERFRITSSDTAIHLDLIAKVHGIPSAEDYFLKVPDSMKDNRIYGALLNVYVRAKMTEKAESLITVMRDKGYTNHALAFNVMMTLYLKLKDYDKVDMVVSEMKERQIPLDIYSYNIWLSSCGSQGSVEKMEQVYQQMTLDRSVIPNWTTFSTMATMYVKMDEIKKAEECLKKVEDRITGRDRIPYHFLISVYGSTGNKEEVYRVWNIYKQVFPFIPNLGYHALISALVRLGDIPGAETFYDEWLSVKASFDPRITNLLMSWYSRKGLSEKAEALFREMVEMGGKPNPATFEILAEGHIRGGRIEKALSCLNNAVLAEGAKYWKPKPVNVGTILKACEEEDDMASKEVLLGVLRRAGCFENEAYMSYIPLSNWTASDGPSPENRTDNDDVDGAEIMLSQLQGSL